MGNTPTKGASISKKRGGGPRILFGCERGGGAGPPGPPCIRLQFRKCNSNQQSPAMIKSSIGYQQHLFSAVQITRGACLLTVLTFYSCKQVPVIFATVNWLNSTVPPPHPLPGPPTYNLTVIPSCRFSHNQQSLVTVEIVGDIMMCDTYWQ